LATVIDKLKEKPNSDKYDFSLIKEYKNQRHYVTLVCSEHGEYKTTLKNALGSKFFGCRKCKIKDDTHDSCTFIDRSNAVHNYYYGYDKVKYSTAHDEVIITCPKHGDFRVKAYTHVSGGGYCSKCTNFVSSAEIEIANFLNQNGINHENSYRGLKNRVEVDIISHEHKIGIEFNGIYWHSDIFKDKKYHINKTKYVNSKGYRLIHIFEDHWIHKKEICKSIILNAFQKTANSIGARKCIVKEVSFDESKRFLEDNHIQGSCISKIRIGLFYNNELVSIMTFGSLRKNLGLNYKDDHYELLRFCNKKFNNVCGGASKLFRYFINRYNPKYILSYCDISRNTGSLYKKLGFKYNKDTKPNYFYIKAGSFIRFNRYSFRKSVIKKMKNYNNETEKDFMKKNGYFRVYDCGSMKFEWFR
jgi:hypothetical protein